MFGPVWNDRGNQQHFKANSVLKYTVIVQLLEPSLGANVPNPVRRKKLEATLEHFCTSSPQTKNIPTASPPLQWHVGSYEEA